MVENTQDFAQGFAQGYAARYIKISEGLLADYQDKFGTSEWAQGFAAGYAKGFEEGSTVNEKE